MLNIHSIRCSLAFAPYIEKRVRAFLIDGAFDSTVVHQGGSGLIIRADSHIHIRHRGAEVSLGRAEAAHYLETIEFRSRSYDLARLSDEIVLASTGSAIMLSHPQSEMWLDSETTLKLTRIAAGEPVDLPEWITASSGGGRLLLSDQRNGRWALLSKEHLAEFNRRLKKLPDAAISRRTPSPPTISLRGVTVHLQSIFGLARSLDSFAESGQVSPLTDICPDFYLSAEKTGDGFEIRDSTASAPLTRTEARKWSSIIRNEIERLRAREFHRGDIRTVVARTEQGLWVLQRGDEVFISPQSLSDLQSDEISGDDPSLVIQRTKGYLLLLDSHTGGCVALDESEAGEMAD
jgi:hypothetical protein